jgi:uncharacterized protein (TIGR02118 family)
MIKSIIVNPDPGAGEGGKPYLTPQGPALSRFSLTRPIELSIIGPSHMPIAGVLECGWFDDEASLASAYGVGGFADLAQPGPGRPLLARENVVVSGPTTPFPDTGVKFISAVKRKAGMSIEEFHRYWWVDHAPIVKTTPRLRRYVQSHLLLNHYAGGVEPPYDGTAELWWDTVADYEASWSSSEMQVDQFIDAAKFCANDPPGQRSPARFLCMTKETWVTGGLFAP